MGFFRKNDQEGSQPRNPDAVFGFRALAAAYILYLEFQTVQLYIKGEATTGIWFLILSLVLMGGGALYILISSFLSWRKEKAELAKQAEESETEE